MKFDMKKRPENETYQEHMESLIRELIENTLSVLSEGKMDYSDFTKPICSVYNEYSENYTHLAFYPVWDESANKLLCIRPAIQDKKGVVALLMNMNVSHLSLDTDFIRCLGAAMRHHRDKYDDDFIESDDFLEWHPNGVWYMKGFAIPVPK